MRRLVAVLVTLAVAVASFLVTRDDDAPPPAPTTPAATRLAPSPPRGRVSTSESEEGDEVPARSIPPSAARPYGEDAWTRRLTVAVTSARDNCPVQGAAVLVLERFDEKSRVEKGETDAAGRVTFDSPERAAVIVRMAGFVTQTVTPDASRGVDESRQVDVALVPGEPLSGRVVHARSRAPVPDAEVYAWDAESRTEIDFDGVRSDRYRSAGVRTAADGTFEFSARPPDHAVVLAVRTDGLATVTKRIAAGAITEPLVIELGGGASVAGFVRDAEGRPITGAEVYAVLRGDAVLLGGPQACRLDWEGVMLPTRATTAADGAYRIEGLATPAGYVVTSARAPWGRGLAEAAELLSPGASAQRDVVVHEQISIRGRCFGPDGQPADFESFAIRLPSGERYENPFPSGSASNRSWFSTTRVVPGKYVVEVRTSGPWPPVSVPITVTANQEAAIEVRFVQGRTLTGVVTDAEGRPIKGIAVSADGHDTRSGRDGTFRIDGTGPGPLRVNTRDPSDSFEPREIDGVVPGASTLAIVLTRAAEVVFSLEGTRKDEVSCWVQTGAGAWSVGTARTRSDGSYRFGRFPPGVPFNLTLRTGREDAAIVVRDLCVPAGGSHNLGALCVRSPRRICGTVTATSGSPIGGAIVERVDATGSGVHSATTDDTGWFALDEAPHEELLVTVDAVGFPRSFHRLVEQPVRIRLESGVSVSGRVVDQDGAPLSGGSLLIRPCETGASPPSSPYWEIKTDSMGEFTVLVPPGRHRLLSRRQVGPRWPDRSFEDTPLCDFYAVLPGPVRVEARMR